MRYVTASSGTSSTRPVPPSTDLTPGPPSTDLTPGLQNWQIPELTTVAQANMFTDNQNGLGPNVVFDGVGSFQWNLCGAQRIVWADVQTQPDAWPTYYPGTVSDNFVFNWQFIRADEDCTWAGDYVDPACDEDGMVFVMVDEWDTPYPSCARYFLMCWTPTYGFKRLGDLFWDWWDFSDNPRTNNVIVTSTGEGGVDVTASSFSGYPSAEYEMLFPGAGEASITALRPFFFPNGGPVYKTSRNTYVIPESLYFPIPHYYAYQVTEYSSTGTLLRSMIVDRSASGVFAGATGTGLGYGIALGAPGSGLIYLSFSTDPFTVPEASLWAVIDVENWVDLGNWATYSVAMNLQTSEAALVSSTRIISLELRFQSTAIVAYWDSDGSSGALGTLDATQMPEVSTGRINAVHPSPGGKLFAFVFKYGSVDTYGHHLDGRTAVYEFDATTTLPSVTQTPIAILRDPYPDAQAAVNAPTWSAMGSRPTDIDSRYVYIVSAIPCRVKGSPFTSHRTQSPPATVPPAGGAPANTLWEDAQVVSGVSGSVSGTLTNALDGLAAQSQFPNHDVQGEPTVWYRYDSQGQRGVLFYWLTLVTRIVRSAATTTVGEHHPRTLSRQVTSATGGAATTAR